MNLLTAVKKYYAILDAAHVSKRKFDLLLVPVDRGEY